MNAAIDIDEFHPGLNNEGVTKSDKVIGKRARLVRLDLGWTQDQLAKKAGVTRNTVRAFERGLGKTRKANSESIAAALGTTLAALEVDEDGRATQKKWSVFLRDLNREDLIIARAYHHASTKVRHRVLHQLQEAETEDESENRDDAEAETASAARAAEAADFITQLRDDAEIRMIEGVVSILMDKRQNQLAERAPSKKAPSPMKVKRSAATKG
jgi:transcriptional regulator with XRE-family HTH domain